MQIVCVSLASTTRWSHFLLMKNQVLILAYFPHLPLLLVAPLWGSINYVILSVLPADWLLHALMCVFLSHQTAATPVTWSVRDRSSSTATRGTERRKIAQVPKATLPPPPPPPLQLLGAR